MKIFFNRIRNSEIYYFSCAIFLTISIAAGGFFGLSWININYVDNVNIQATVDNKIVYQGVSACARVSTAGANSILQINSRKSLCLKPIEYFVSRNIVVTNINQ